MRCFFWSLPLYVWTAFFLTAFICCFRWSLACKCCMTRTSLWLLLQEHFRNNFCVCWPPWWVCVTWPLMHIPESLCIMPSFFGQLLRSASVWCRFLEFLKVLQQVFFFWSWGIIIWNPLLWPRITMTPSTSKSDTCTPCLNTRVQLAVPI